MWHVACGMWHVTHDTWHVTGGARWAFSKNFSSLALTVCEWRCFEDIFTKDDLLTNSLTNLIKKVFVEQPRLHPSGNYAMNMSMVGRITPNMSMVDRVTPNMSMVGRVTPIMIMVGEVTPKGVISQTSLFVVKGDGGTDYLMLQKRP